MTDFEVLYQSDCQACHGANGKQGTAVSLAGPACLAYAGKERVAEVTAKGVGGSFMPAFATNAGGVLKEQQRDILANGVVTRWGNDARSPWLRRKVRDEWGPGLRHL